MCGPLAGGRATKPRRGGQETSEDHQTPGRCSCEGFSDTGLLLARESPCLPLPRQNERRVSSATEETSLENGYIVLKCFEVLSMVSRDTQGGESGPAR